MLLNSLSKKNCGNLQFDIFPGVLDYIFCAAQSHFSPFPGFKGNPEGMITLYNQMSNVNWDLKFAESEYIIEYKKN